MAKLPKRWKLFRVANFFQAFILIAFTILILSYLIDTGETDGLIWVLLILLAFTSIIVNNFFNLHLLSKHFPDIALSAKKERKATVLFILYLLLTIASLVISIMAIISQFSEERLHWSSTVLVCIFASSSFIGVYILIEQATLPGLIERNQKITIRRMTEEIGA